MSVVSIIDGNFLHSYYLAVAILFLSVIWYLRSRKDDNNSIPGPKQLPLIGNAHQLDIKPYLTFMKWAKQYGPIMYLKLATEKMVVLTDPAIIKELFNDPLTTGRQGSNHPIFYEMNGGPYGIINAEGEVWETQRKFTIKTLREFGFGKASMEKIIMTEVDAMMDWLRRSQGILIPGNHIFEGAMLNIIWAMVSGKRCDWANEKESGAVRISKEFVRAIQQITDNGLYFAPFLRHILPERSGWTRYKKSVADFKQLFEETVQHHKETLDKTNLGCFIDYYLKEIEETEDEHSSFYKDIGHKGLLAVLSDLFLAGSVTTAGTLTWFLLFISHHSEIQRKAQKQIDQVIGSSRSPAKLDRNSLPYVEAIVLESLRLGNIAPLGVPHRALEDINYKGYLIKKDVTIIGNLYGVHHDPEIWGDPNNFRPERFLNEDGTELICESHEAVIPFLEGKRKCIGEKLARDEMFLFVAGMLQKFNILPESGKKPNFESKTGLFLHVPHDFQVMITPRNQE